MIKGITAKEEEIIKKILIQYPYEFYYYGSRVKGGYTKASDLDILIKDKNEIPLDILEKIDLKFNESIIPYRVNFTDYNRIQKDFYNLIKNDLVRIQ